MLYVAKEHAGFYPKQRWKTIRGTADAARRKNIIRLNPE